MHKSLLVGILLIFFRIFFNSYVFVCIRMLRMLLVCYSNVTRTYVLVWCFSHDHHHLSRILTEISFKQQFQLFLVFVINFTPWIIHADRINCQFAICSCVLALFIFFQRFSPFIIQETARKYAPPPPFSLLRNVVYPFASECPLKTS